eukprot:232983-Pelagomonas_calceolata.AAC.7
MIVHEGTASLSLMHAAGPGVVFSFLFTNQREHAIAQLGKASQAALPPNCWNKPPRLIRSLIWRLYMAPYRAEAVNQV